jgi:diaminopimelate epimerase
MRFIKSHAFGNDFLLLEEDDLPAGADPSRVARRVCDRHRGLGADGLLIYRIAHQPDAPRASMRLFNADGSPSEISGNGLRCLAAWIAHAGGGAAIAIDTAAGTKRLDLLGREGSRYTFSAAMGQPEGVRQDRLTVGDLPVDVVILRVGNPQCVVLGEVSAERLHGLAARLAVHPHFPEGTNVELASVEAPALVRILIWERGVGPTDASGTGACAAAVAAIQYGGADRDVQIASPGGTQRVEWREDGLHLTGWAELVAEARWVSREP